MSDPKMVTALSHPPRYERLHALSFELRRLRQSSSEQLGAALIGADTETSSADILRARLIWPFDDVAVIEKCNAVIVVATVSVDSDPDFVREVLLERWLEEAPDLERVLPQVDHYSGLRALEYLGEVAVGLRSVVLGDAQVYSQVVRGLRTARSAGDQGSPFSVVSRRLAGLRKAVRSGTSLQEGNLSLERIAAERLTAELGTSGARIAVVGYGRTGQLIVDILSKETKHDLVLTNRTAPRDTSAFPGRLVTAPWGDLSFYDAVEAVVLCVTNTAETRSYAERAFQALTSGDLPLVLDMSSPSITRQVAASPERLLLLDELAAQSTYSLETRQRGVNKAKDVVRQWAEVLERDLAVSADRAGRGRPELASPPGSFDPATLRKAQMLGAIRDYLADEGFLETYSRCLGSTGRADRALRRSIRIDTGLAATQGPDRVYEIGPVWAPDASWAPAAVDEAYVLAAGIRRPGDVDQVVDLALGLVERVARTLAPTDPSSRRLSYETVLEMLQHGGYSVAYGSRLDFDLLRSVADVVRFGTGERLVAVTNCPEPSERFEIARHPKTGLSTSFRIVLDGWQVASGFLVERDADGRRRRMVLAGVPVPRARTLLHDGDEEPPTGVIEVALDQLMARCLASADGGDRQVNPSVLSTT